MRGFFSRGALLLLAVAMGVSVSIAAQGARNFNKTVQLIAGRADTVELDGAVADVLVANPAVADVGTLRSNRLYIVGRAVGDTNVLAYDEAGNQLANISVHVRLDDKNLQNTLREFFPDEKITAKTVKNDVVLSGTVSSPAISNRVRDLAKRFMLDQNQTLVDLMSVRGEQQVMLKVRVLEARRSILRDLGFETDWRQGSSNGFKLDGGLAGQGAGDIGRSTLQAFGAGSLLIGQKGKWGPLSTILRGLETDGIVNTLAEPNLTAISGETAGFLAGGEFPIPTGRDAQGNIILEFKQFGVSLNFTPTVLDKDRIALHMSTEVSEKDTANSLRLTNLEVPGLTVRRAETTVEVGSGGTIMIAGLIKSDTLETMNGMPGAHEVPVLGRLLKSDSFKRNESELLIIVTPYLVDAYAEPAAVAEAPPAPSPAKQAKVPEKTGRIIPPARTREEAPATASLLSQRFVDNLKKTYGSRMPENIGAGAGFGYIVD